MANIDFKERRVLGRTGLEVSRMGLAAGYNVPEGAVEKAFHEYNINYFYWETRKLGMETVLRSLARGQRDEIVIAIQTYDHLGPWIKKSVEKALLKLQVAYVDILFLGWFNSMPFKWVLDQALRLKEEGKVKHLGFSGHNRAFHAQMACDPQSPFDVQMIRYNAAHRGAESEIFNRLGEGRPGITTYTATRWGKLVNPKKMPDHEKPLTPAECYRFVLSHPTVDLCLAGPRNEREMIEGFQALDQGPLTEDEMIRVQNIGDFVHG